MAESADIETVQTYLSEYNGYDTKYTTFKVGPSAKLLYIREDLLESVPALEQIVTHDEITAKNPCSLPEFDAQAFADVLHFIEENRVEPLATHNSAVQGLAQPDIHAGAHRYIRAYIVAHQLQVEPIQNRLMDILSKFYLDNLIQPEAILLLSQANLQSSNLYSLLMEETARGVQAGFYNARESESVILVNDVKSAYKTVMEKWAPQDFLALAGQIGRLSPKKKRTIAVVAKVDPCLFHAHTTTPPCKSLKRKREDERTPRSALIHDMFQVEGRMPDMQIHIVDSIEDDASMSDGTPTRKRRRVRPAQDGTRLREYPDIRKQKEADRQNVRPAKEDDKGHDKTITCMYNNAPFEDNTCLDDDIVCTPGPA